MFGSNALSLPPAFAHEHRPLRLSSEGTRQPTGECRYELPHPSPQKQRCSCQYFHHNRSAPGNICECGHQACFHVHDTPNDRQVTADPINPITLTTIMDKIKRLEETVQNERKNRENALQRERQLWEREVRVLREALAPFYKKDEELRAKLGELEDRMEGNYDEQVRLKHRVEALDEANMALERKVDDMEEVRTKKRRKRLNHVNEDANSHAHGSTDVRCASSSLDERSVATPSSRALSPHGLMPTPPEPEEPRSSGILNLVELHRTQPLNMPPRIPLQPEEARSSGFLTLDLVDRLSQKAASENGHDAQQPSPQSIVVERPSPPSYPGSLPDGIVTAPSMTPPDVITVSSAPFTKRVDTVTVVPISTSPMKRKHPSADLALKVLADVSTRETLIH